VSADAVVGEAGRLARGIRPDDLESTLLAITRAAVRTLPDVHEASISILQPEGRLETVAPTSAVLNELDEAQTELGEGPCLEASENGVHIVSPDLLADPRFPRYSRAAARLGFVAQAGFGLFVRDSSRGALNLYSQRPGSFADIATVAPLFAEQATLALSYAMDIDNLTRALETRTSIGQAVGIVMERYRLDEKASFAFLTRLSQHQNIKLRDIAAAINQSVVHSKESGSG